MNVKNTTLAECEKSKEHWLSLYNKCINFKNNSALETMAFTLYKYWQLKIAMLYPSIHSNLILSDYPKPYFSLMCMRRTILSNARNVQASL